jgi:hypothetical protein
MLTKNRIPDNELYTCACLGGLLWSRGIDTGRKRGASPGSQN